jgi:SAM-dependent methyltransferase
VKLQEVPLPDLDLDPQDKPSHPFDEAYFNSGAYADVSFSRYSQYWWSNRFYSLLAKRYGPSEGRALEVGCGLGHLLGWLVDRYQVYGTDINAWALAQAQRNVPAAHFALLSAENLGGFQDGTFQIVIAKHVVEHLPYPDRAVAEVSRILAPHGVLILATPNLDSYMRKVKKDKWIGYKDSTHISLKPPAEWLEMLRLNGLSPKRVFSDGFWDAPYMSVIPAGLQKAFFGAPGGLQAILGWSMIPVRMGESLIVIAERD